MAHPRMLNCLCAPNMSKFRKVVLLLWKNYLIQIRTPISTSIQFLIPLLVSFLLLAVRFLVKFEAVNEPVTFDSFDVDDCLRASIIPHKVWLIGYSPVNSSIVKEIITNMDLFQNLSNEKKYDFEGFNDEAEMISRMNTLEAKNTLLAGIVFDDSKFNSNKSSSQNFVVKIKFPGLSRIVDNRSTTLDTQAPNWRTNLVKPMFEPFGPRDEYSKFGGQPGYCEEGFLSLQHSVYKAILKTYNPNRTAPFIDFQRFPYPPYIKDQFLPALTLFFSSLLIIMYTYNCVHTIKMVTLEKETKMKSAMKIMGLPNWMHWTAWTIKCLVQWWIPTICITILLTYGWEKGSVIKKTDPFVLFTILAGYTMTSIMFCFLISVCFNTANSAATIGSALWFLSYSPFMIFQPKYERMHCAEVLGWSFISNTNMGFLFQCIINFEGSGIGLQWHNFFDLNSPNDKISCGHLFMVMLFDGLLYFCLAIYIESVFPGSYGIPKSWYFPLQSSYWCGTKDKSGMNSLQKGIQIRNLKKIYGNGKLAVNNLTLDMHEDQITVLLGNNGAGKSTTMSVLSGLIKPTSGSASINGYDIWTDKSKIRSFIGFCPQYNLLFPELTIKEHLQFFGMLKGVHGQQLDKEIDKYVTKLGMTKKLYFRAGSLSGGYQRKLSVAIALIGQSKVVLMDEPTSGMDPVARRQLWDLLQSEREGRTMVMTTHLMDEADLLGDRVAIMCNSQLKCVGTPFNLKTDPDGYRYTLTLVKMSNNETNVEKITNFLQDICENVRLTSISDTEIKYKLLDSKEMPKLLAVLEASKRNCGIKEYGVSLISLEDVYIRVTEDATEEQSRKDENEKYHNEGKDRQSYTEYASSTTPIDLPNGVEDAEAITAWQRWKDHFHAMLFKKILTSRRCWSMILTICAITLIFFCIATIVTKSWRGAFDLPALNLTLTEYRDPIIIRINNTREQREQFFDDYKTKANVKTNFVKILNSLVEEQSGQMEELPPNGTITDFVLKKYKEHIQLVNDRYISGIELTKNKNNTDAIRLYFNNQFYHSLPIAYGLLQNATFKLLTREDNSLTFVNFPFPFQAAERLVKLEGGSNFGFQIGFNTGFSQAFICATFLLPTLKEKVNGAIHLQFVSGVAPSAFWISSVLWDFIVYLLPMSVEVIALYVYQDEAFSSHEQLVQVIVLLIAYAWSITPIMNLLTYVFDSPSLGFLVTSVMSALTGCACFLINLILEIRPLLLIDEAEHMDDFMVWFPHYALCNGLRNIYINFDQTKICQNGGCVNGDKYGWKRPGIGQNLFALIIIGLCANAILYSLEFVFDKKRKIINIIYKYWSHLGRKPGMEAELNPQSPSDEDDDVIQEKFIVEKSSKLEYCILMKDVTKKYGNFTVVRSTNLALRAHECFALLGSNGAGKTTTFKMLTSKLNVTSGSIDICSMDIVRHQDQVCRVIGYCPQQDSLLEKLTGRETLTLFCIVRGIPKSEINLVISQLSSRLKFHKFLDVVSGSYSGGNKRKLNTAIAMVGDPPVLLLDEPTSGMDPDARRHLWNVIKEERERGKCIIITTHSLEECEALCTRLAIMVEGEIRAIGSVQYLKNKYASGYKLHVKFPTKLLENVKLHVTANLPGSSILEEFKGMIVFHIPSVILCSTVFYMMEEAKSKSIIEDYSIQQTSLEQVFIRVLSKSPVYSS